VNAPLARHDIVCISSIDWDFIWQGHQEIMASLAREGHRVLFIENTGVRPPRLRDLPRVTHRIRNWWRGVKGFRKERENLFVYSPIILPFPYSRVALRINRSLVLRALRRWMKATGFGRPLVWTFLPTPLARDVIRDLEPELIVYYCIDDLASSSPAARRVSRSEAQLFREADLVFVTSRRLRERARQFTDRVHLFPFGVDFEMFQGIRRASTETPPEMATLTRPVAGYVGGIHQWLDQPLLADVAGRLPDVSFVLVGPLQTDTSVLGRCPNIHLLGARSHGDVPRYIKGFDVGIIPYRLSDYTVNVYPTKLNEYLAMGLSVVATDLPEIRHFNAEHGEVVGIGATAQAFAEAIRQAIEKSAPADVERRIETARENAWSTRIARMSALIEERVRARRAAGDRWEDSLRRLYRAARRRITSATLAVLALYVLVFHTPAMWLAAEPLVIVDTPRPADAIVVFAGGVGESGKAGGGYQERVKQAVDLYQQGLAARVIFSSGYSFAFRETEVMRELAIAHGVPDSAILLEKEASSTYENVWFVNRLLAREGWRRILLVSSPYHMRRALLTWRKVAPDVEVISTPVPATQFYAQGTAPTLEQLGGLVHEYVGIVVYWWAGRV